MSPIMHKLHALEISFPRVSGDEPKGLRTQVLVRLFSPRERG